MWSDHLLELIRGADVFQLFWSRNAMVSEYVRAEWEFALSLRRPHFIRPVYWEEPLPEQAGLPPGELRALHFQRIYPKTTSSTDTGAFEVPMVLKNSPVTSGRGEPESTLAQPSVAETASPVRARLLGPAVVLALVVIVVFLVFFDRCG